jgi:hypothetical protein
MICLLRLILPICLATGSMGSIKMIKREYELEFLLYVGLFEQLEMTLFLTDKRELIFCRRATYWIQQ